MLRRQGPNIFVPESIKKGTWWNCRKCCGRTKVIYTMQQNCFYNRRGGGFHCTMGNDATEILRINFLTLDPYRITHFSVSENRGFFLPLNVTKFSEVPIRDVMVVQTRHCAHNRLNIASPYSSL